MAAKNSSTKKEQQNKKQSPAAKKVSNLTTSAIKKTGASKRGLGKGLDSLIPDYEPAPKEEKAKQGEINISINDVEPNRTQPRQNFDEEELNRLADSIKQFGIIEPLIVQKKNDGKRFEIIAGERRFRAARLAGLKEVPVIVRDYADDDKLTIALLENIQRSDLNPIEEAMAYQRLLEKGTDMTQEKLAEKVSKPRTTITNTMRLLKLPVKLQVMVASGELSEGHGRTLLGLSDEKQQLEAARIIIDKGLSVRAAEDLVKNLNESKKPVKKRPAVIKKDESYKQAEEKMKRVLGTKVEIRKKSETSGQIYIDYYSIDDLDRIVEILEQK